jgi:chemotaxis protein methyltransferase CheR
LGQLKEALQWCDKALEADRLTPGVYYLRASILLEQGERPEALQSLQRAVYLDSEFVMAHFALGNLLLLQGKSSEARLHLANAQRLLGSFAPDAPVPESEGLLAGQLMGIITAMQDTAV